MKTCIFQKGESPPLASFRLDGYLLATGAVCLRKPTRPSSIAKLVLNVAGVEFFLTGNH
jgi:hypothetical protein